MRRQKAVMCMSQRRHAQIVRMVRMTDPVPTAAQRTLFNHLRDMLAQIAQDASYPGPWRVNCEEAWEILTRDKRTVY